MKKNVLYIIACGTLILAAAACSKEQANNEPQEESAGLVTESLSAQKEDDATKITMTPAGVFGWSEYDQVAVNIFDGTSHKFVSSDRYGATEAGKFTVSYTGTRKGVAVTPVAFAKSFDGNDLVVTYPTEYDISYWVDKGVYDNANGSAYIRFPMVSISESGESALKFYSIGALVQVKMGGIPKGTKYVYVTFNQTVTGDFTVANPGSTTPSVTVSDTATPSTVKIRISESGLAEEKDIVLYIPVPTTTGLEITSSTEAKATVSRNKGYSWSVKCITRADASTDFYFDDADHVVAPGNLWAKNVGGVVEYYFMKDVLCTTQGGYPNDPHVDGNTKAPSRANPGEYQDLFTWNDFYSIMMGKEAPEGTAQITKAITIDGQEWYAYGDSWRKFWDADQRTYANSVKIRGNQGKVNAFVEINVSGTPYAPYALYARATGEPKTMISGRLFFPDGYVDQTAWISDSALDDARGACEINYDVFEKILKAGAVFLPQTGIYYSGKYHVSKSTGLTYHHRVTYYSNPEESSKYINGNYGQELTFNYGSRQTYRSVRLVRTVTP